MRRPPPRSTRTYTLLPSTTLFRSGGRRNRRVAGGAGRHQNLPFDYRPPRGRVPDPARGAVRPCVRGARLWHARFHAIDAQRISDADRSEEHTSELQSLMRSSYADFCLKKKKTQMTSIIKM